MNSIDVAFEIKEMEASGSFAGFGSVYGNVDGGGDIVAENAFSKSLSIWQSKGRMPALLWQHNAKEPIGAFQKMEETPQGLYVEGSLALKTRRGAEAYELLKMKALSGLSIDYITKDSDLNTKTGIRTIHAAELYGVSLVTFPMNDAARVTSIKSIEEIGDLSGAESYLREVGGVSRSEAKALISRLFSIARREAAAKDNSQEFEVIATLLKQRQGLMT
jgi:HK97 family phage prohead protease